MIFNSFTLDIIVMLVVVIFFYILKEKKLVPLTKQSVIPCFKNFARAHWLKIAALWVTIRQCPLMHKSFHVYKGQLIDIYILLPVLLMFYFFLLIYQIIEHEGITRKCLKEWTNGEMGFLIIKYILKQHNQSLNRYTGKHSIEPQNISLQDWEFNISIAFQINNQCCCF